MPLTAEQLYQEFLVQKKDKPEDLYNEFSRQKENPLIEQESKNRELQSSEQALKSFFQFPPVRPMRTEPTIKEMAQEIPRALMSAGIQTGIGVLGGLEKPVKEIMPTGAYKEIVEKEHPMVKKFWRGMGTIGRYVGIGKIFAPLSPAISNIDALRFLGPAYQVGIGTAVSRGLTWGTAKFIDNLSKVATDMQDATKKNMIWETLEAGGWGSLLGATQAVGLGIGPTTTLGELENTFTHFLLAGIIGGSREGADKLTSALAGEKLSIQDLTDMGTAALFTGIVEAIGHYQLKNAWKRAEIHQYYQEKNISRIMRTTGMSKAEAAKEAQWMGDFIFNIQNKPAYIQTVMKHIPQEFYQYSPETQIKIVNNLVSNVKTEGMSFSDAFNNAIATIGAPEVPKLPTPLIAPKEPKAMKTVQQVRYGHWLESQLKDLGWADKDITEYKENKSFKDMTVDEASRTIKKMENIFNIADDLSKTSVKTPKQLKRDVSKRFKAMEKKVNTIEDFKVLIEESTPPELLKYNGRDYRLFDHIRPSRKAFRRDPFVYFNGYLPIYDGYSNLKIAYEEKAEAAIKLAKKLKLTNDELKDINYKRHLTYFKTVKMSPSVANTPLPELNDRQKEFDDFLTREYQWAHPYFNVKGFVPYHMYSPLLRERQQMEIAILKSFFPEKLPEFIKAFFQEERTSEDTEGLKTDALEGYLKYMRSGFKKKFLEGPLRETHNKIIKNPHVKDTMKAAIKSYGTWMMGWPSPADESYNAMFKDLGLQPDDAQMITRFLMNLVYSSTISPRPTLLLKQLLQNLSTANELGYNWTTSGLMSFLQNGFDEARKAGVLLEYAPEIYREYGKKIPLDRLRELMTWAFHREDMFGRTVAYYAAKNKWDYHYKRSKNIPEFMKRAGVNHLDKTEQWRIKDQLKRGNIYEARRIFFKEIVGKVHYKYGKPDAPLVTKYQLGKLFMQLHTWPENLGELYIENAKNKHGMFFLRQLLAALFVSWLGYQTKQKWMVGYPVTSIPLSRYKLEKTIGVPVALQPLADVMFLISDPALKYLYDKDPEAAEKLFKSALKRLGKDALLYFPGGLALKDLYGVKDFIPFQPSGNKPMVNLKNIVR